MDDSSKAKRFQFQVLDLLAVMVIVSVLGAAIRFSARYLPSIKDNPPLLGETHQWQNWVGQGDGAYILNSFLLLVVVYFAKWIILDRCTRRLAAVELFAVLVALSLPYIWFLCEPDWTNPFVYRVSCWFGGPITIWFIPAVSFIVDLGSFGKTKSLKRYSIRSAIEAVIAFPVWAIGWAYFSFFILGWGWI
jgi:hypothetical protein